MTTGDMDVFGLQNVIWPSFSSQLRWRDVSTKKKKEKDYLKKLTDIQVSLPIVQEDLTYYSLYFQTFKKIKVEV